MAKRDDNDPALVGFLEYYRGPHKYSSNIAVWEIVNALRACSELLCQTIDSLDDTHQDGLATENRVLTVLLEDCQADERIVRKKRREPPSPDDPRGRKGRPELTAVPGGKQDVAAA